MSSSIQIVDEKHVDVLPLHDQDEKKTHVVFNELSFGSHGGCCAICLDTIPLQETAMIKGCEHAYCVTCILRWASCKEIPTCPKCKLPFSFLDVHRTLDGRIEDFMFEESVCLLLRAPWFQPLEAVERISDNDNFSYDIDIPPEYVEEQDDQEDEDDLDEFYFHDSDFQDSGLRLGNRRWGDNGFVRAGRQDSRPVQQKNRGDHQASVSESSSSSLCEPKDKSSNAITGRRAKRAMKREAANKAAEAVAARGPCG